MGVVGDTYDYVVDGKYSEYVRYVIFGVLNVLVTWVAYAIFVIAGIDPVISNGLSWVVGVIVAFICNKFWVFYSKSVARDTVEREAVTFLAERIFTGVLAIVTFWFLYDIGINQFIFGLEGFYAKILTSGMEIVLNFFISKYYVFKSRSESRE
jgi:putative flippase GtrA